MYTIHSYAAVINYKNNTTNHCIKKLNQITDAHSQCLIEIQQQLSDNQHEIDILQGHIQDIQHRISKIINNQKESYQQLYNMLNTYNNNHYDNNQQPYIKNSITNTKQNKEHNETIINNDNYIHSEYKQAVTLVLEKKQYNQAIEAFQDFVKKYPKSEYQSNAHYWLGQLYYNQKNTENATYHFAIVAHDYPKSIKAPDALLKIGIIMQETEQKDKAKIIYKQIGKLYPDSDAAKQAQKRLTYL